MSNELAIATVTAVLSEWIRPAVEEIAGAGVTMARPDELATTTSPGANVFLYRVEPNAAFRQQDLPTRRPDGTVVARPTTAWDLHYLLTFYGADLSLEPQRIMGAVLRTLHARPILSRRAIEDTIASGTFAFLAGSDLAEQTERIRLTPLPLDVERISQLWSMFFETAYRLSITYLASLVLIEADVPAQSALPVRQRNIYARPFRPPVLERISAEGPYPDIVTSQSSLLLEGRTLRGEATRLRLGGTEYDVAGTALTDKLIRLDLSTAAPVRGQLRAGLRGVQVLHRVLMGLPLTEHEGVESNVLPLLIRPVIQQHASGAYAITISGIETDAEGHRFRAVAITMSTEIGARQRVVLLLNEYNVAVDPAAYMFPAEPRDADGYELTFVIAPDISGEFLIRVQVDGAASPLERDEDETSATYGLFVAPRRTT